MRSNRRPRYFWMVLFLTVAVATSGGRLWHARQPGSITPVDRREMMTALTLPELDGGTWKLADHRGRVVLINYWATWCEPCREELPGLIHLAQETAPANRVAIAGIALDTGDNTQQAVRSFATQFHIPYPIVMPDAATRSSLEDMGLPTTILLDKHGRVARTYSGATEHDDFAADIAVLLAEN